jgi:hypothetical protein
METFSFTLKNFLCYGAIGPLEFDITQEIVYQLMDEPHSWTGRNLLSPENIWEYGCTLQVGFINSRCYYLSIDFSPFNKNGGLPKNLTPVGHFPGFANSRESLSSFAEYLHSENILYRIDTQLSMLNDNVVLSLKTGNRTIVTFDENNALWKTSVSNI